MERTGVAPIGRAPIKLEREAALARPDRPFEAPLRQRISVERSEPLGKITTRVQTGKKGGQA